MRLVAESILFPNKQVAKLERMKSVRDGDSSGALKGGIRGQTRTNAPFQLPRARTCVLAPRAPELTAQPRPAGPPSVPATLLCRPAA